MSGQTISTDEEMDIVAKVMNHFTPLQQHHLLLLLAEKYDYDYAGDQFHICEMCHIRDFEHGGQGTHVAEYEYCEVPGCGFEICEECLEKNLDNSTIIGSHTTGAYGIKEIVCAKHPKKE